jgi:hypothetical protein
VAAKLTGLAEIAELLHVGKRTALRYSKRPDFPHPVERLAAGPVWRQDAVERWARAHLPLPVGRPRIAGPGARRKGT